MDLLQLIHTPMGFVAVLVLLAVCFFVFFGKGRLYAPYDYHTIKAEFTFTATGKRFFSRRLRKHTETDQWEILGSSNLEQVEEKWYPIHRDVVACILRRTRSAEETVTTIEVTAEKEFILQP